MKNRIALFAATVLVAVSCAQNIAEPVNCTITLDPANTYLVGDPVRFLVNGHADNILFYSGETGFQYRYKDRYSVPAELVKSATLSIDCYHEWGQKDGLEIFISNTFTGLDGNDGAADRATVQRIIDSNMDGWTRIFHDDNSAQKETDTVVFDVDRYRDNFSVAIHWHPVDTLSSGNKATQRSYRIKGIVSLDIDAEDTPPANTYLNSLHPVVVTMNPELDPYYKNKDAGSVNFNGEDEIYCRGVAAGALEYRLDAWIFTTPTVLNKVANDRGTVIKDLQNYMTSYEFPYAEAGSYTATFVCINNNYMGSSSSVQSVDFSIIEEW